LGQALRGAVRAIAELPILETPVIAAVEGSEATIEAFRRLTSTFYGLLSFKLPPSADELRELQKKAIQSVEQNAPPPPSPEGGGLSQRDYVPLAVAIFVDICLLLVSIGRPGHRLHGLMPKMREAERGPVIEILSRFNDIHRDPEIRESFELFRHVVFDLHGAYYVAVPLDAPPHLGAPERDDLRTEAQLLANLFTSFEKDRIFKRTWAPFNATIQKKLARQGSKFAGSEAFRVYKFRDGAWSEIILGAVMGAARRAEAEENRRRIERDILRTGPFLRTEPRFTDSRAAHEPAGHDRNARGSTARENTAGDNKTSERPVHSRPADLSLKADRHEPHAPSRKPDAPDIWRSSSFRYAAKAPPAATTGFGPYARSAAAELNSAIAGDDPLAPPANSNTAPALQRTVRTEPQAPDAILVPHSPDPAAAASASEPNAPRVDVVAAPRVDVVAAPRMDVVAAPRVDVVLKRETATVSLPLENANEQGGLIGRLTEALAASDPAEENKSPAVSPGFESQLQPNNRAKEPRQLEYVTPPIEDNISTDDAATMAKRLRPALRNG
jgi:hypothetical protein